MAFAFMGQSEMHNETHLRLKLRRACPDAANEMRPTLTVIQTTSKSPARATELVIDLRPVGQVHRPAETAYISARGLNVCR